MAVTDFFAGEIATEILRMLIIIIRKACLCKYSAEQLILTINELLPIIHEIKYSGVELTATRQHQLDAIFGALHDGHELAGKVLNSSRWNVYKSLKLSRKMDKLEKRISKFVQGPLQAYVLAHVHHLRFESMDRRSESMEPMDRRSESMEQMDRLDGSFSRVEQRLGSMMIGGGGGGGGWWSEAVVRTEEEEVYEGSLVKVGMELGKRRVKDMILDRDDLSVIGINGIGGSGKTTLAREICRDDDVQNDVKIFNGLCYFNFQSISSATNNFSSTNLLGKGGFGEVYKGKLVDGQEVAVKRLSRSSGQGVKEFKNEMELIAKLQHTNLVRLLGFCVEKQEKILVYEYMSNNSLDFFLFDPKKKGLLDWNNRFVIIDGIAQGLLYLHKFSRLRIIHRDLKASNILLDDYLKPKISDFGMAKLFGINESEANTSRPVGTRGYMPPEYLIDGIISTKIDVFGFGVLLLETISSKRNHVSYDEGHPLNLLGLAWELWNKGRGLELMDPLLEDTCSPKEVMTCIHVGLLCVQDHATDRPTMSEVISMLTNENMHLPEPKQPAFFVERGETWTRVVQKARGSKLGLVARLIKARIKLATKT